jgi:hypothetical protein
MSLRVERGNLLPIPEIASAGFVSLAMTEWGVILNPSLPVILSVAKNLRDSSPSK